MHKHKTIHLLLGLGSKPKTSGNECNNDSYGKFFHLFPEI